MNMELFENIQPFPKQIKGSRSFRIGYGYCTTRNPYYKSSKRRLNKYYRKYGFDITETFDLDATIMYWMSDNVGGFFRECGNPEDWCGLIENLSSIEKVTNLYKARKAEYLSQLYKYLSDCTEDEYRKFLNFVTPRILYLRKHTHGYPAQFNSIADWQQELKTMWIKLLQKNINKFIDNFYSLWD